MARFFKKFGLVFVAYLAGVFTAEKVKPQITNVLNKVKGGGSAPSA